MKMEIQDLRKIVHLRKEIKSDSSFMEVDDPQIDEVEQLFNMKHTG